MNIPPRTAIHRSFGVPAAQRGAALLVALILLVVITLVGLAAIGTTILQNRMSANQYDRQIAFQATEAAMRQAAIAITTNANITATVPAPAGSGIEDCSTPTGSTTPTNVCQANPFSDSAFASGGGAIEPVSKTDFNAGSLAANQPQYVVQYMGCFQGPQGSIVDISIPGAGSGITSNFYFYRITARSGDPKLIGDRSVVTLQSMFRNQACSP
jgi:type IV pilus assembly protein PilX